MLPAHGASDFVSDDFRAIAGREAGKRLTARRAVIDRMRKARRPLTRTEIAERSKGVSAALVRAEIEVMIDAPRAMPYGITLWNDYALYQIGESPGLVDGKILAPDLLFLRFDLQPGDQFLLCSDGLSNYLTKDEIITVLEEPEGHRIVPRLIDCANARPTRTMP